MKRFTEKHYHGIDHYLLCSADCHADMDCVDCPAFENAVERLAAYEDTGLDAEQICQGLGLDYYIKDSLRKEMEG